MKLILLFKSLTLVAFLITGSVGWTQTGTPPGVVVESDCIKLSNIGLAKMNPEQKSLWKSKCDDNAGSCKDAKKDYYDKAGKETEACSGFTQERGNDGKPISCSKQFANCQAQMNGVFNDGANPSNGASYLMQFATQMAVNKMAGTNANPGVSGSSPVNCIEEFDPKEVRNAEKELAREKKELEKEIKKEQEEQIKLGKERNEKQDKMKKETAELEAENKKAILAKDKQMSEETSKIAKNAVEIGKRVRMYTIAIKKKSQELAKNNFEYQSALLEFTDEKVTMQCKQQFEALKAAIIQAKGKLPTSASAATPEEKKQNEQLAAAIGAGTGIKATQNATIFLNAAKKACFEKANTTKQKNMLANSQTVANLNGEMEELKKSIADEKNQLATDQKQIKTLQDQTNKEKSQEEAEKLEKLANLNSELTNFITSNEQELELSKTQAAKLTNDIKNLVLKVNFNAKPAMADAKKAIFAFQGAREEAFSACCSDEKSKKTLFCKQIIESNKKEKFDDKPEKPDSLYPTGDEQGQQ